MEIFTQDPLVRIVGLAEIRPRTKGIRLARQLNIPVTQDYRTLLKMKHVDLVIDVTGNTEVEHALLQIQTPHLALVGGASAKFMWRLIEARTRATAEIEKTLTRYQSLFRLYVKEEAERAVQEERTRIACEIHDGLVQTLVGGHLKLDRCRQLVKKDPEKCQVMLGRIKKEMKHAIQEARQVVYNLPLSQNDALSLGKALKNYLKGFEKQHPFKIMYKGEGEESTLDQKTKVFLFRMIQEAMSNVAHHANASRVDIDVFIGPSEVMASIRDNGKGFDAHSVLKDPEKWDHFGLRGMMERARLLSGKVCWDSEIGKGTCVMIQVPTMPKKGNGHE